jgi:signal transduction histidine kinase
MPDGTVKYVHTVAHCRTYAGQLEVIGAVQDVTQRRLSEDALAKVRSELAYQGRLWAEPNDGPGATFSFSIPDQTT